MRQARPAVLAVLWFCALLSVCRPPLAAALETDNPRLAPLLAQVPEHWWEGGWDQTDALRRLAQFSAQPVAQKAEAQFWYACNLYALRRYDDAIAEFRRLLEQFGTTDETWAIRAKAQYELGQVFLYALRRYDEAAAAYAAVVSQYPEAEEALLARLMLGYATAQQGRLDEALNAYQAVFTDYPLAPASASAQTRLELARGRFECGRVWVRKAQASQTSARDRQAALTQALAQFKQALIQLPAGEADLRLGVVDAIHSAFIALDGNAGRAHRFLEYQLGIAQGAPTRDEAGQPVPDPLAEF